MLLVAIVLDIGTLVVLLTVVGNPYTWQESAGTLTRTMIVATTITALAASIMILVFARAAGALAGNRVDLSAGSSSATSTSSSTAPSSR